MNRTESEDRLAARLTRLAEYAVTEPSALPAMAEVTPAEDHRRSRTPIWATVPAAAVVLVAITLILTGVLGGSNNTVRTRAGSPSDTPAAVEPTGPAVRFATIEASDFHFEAQHYEVSAGITELKLVSAEGTHTLVFAEPQFSYVHLASPASVTGEDSVKVDFVEGQTYTIFCTIAGHRAAGMEATITVVPVKPGSEGDLSFGTPTTTTVP